MLALQRNEMFSRDKFIFYLVELRTWNDGTAFPYVRNRIGFTKDYLRKEKFTIISNNSKNSQLKCGNFLISITQFVFKEISVAKTYFENLKKLQDSEMLEAFEVSLLQVEATSVNDARILPPSSYEDKNAIWLEAYQPHLSNQELRQKNLNSSDL